jgi:ribosomal protein S12 methylthiotransferase
MGVFRYSDEEDTAAYDYPDKVPRQIARERHRRLMAIQREIMAEQLEALVGEEETVLVDSDLAGQAHGRLASQAPEIDGVVFLKGACAPGELVRARITGVRGVDLDAEALAP